MMIMMLWMLNISTAHNANDEIGTLFFREPAGDLRVISLSSKGGQRGPLHPDYIPDG